MPRFSDSFLSEVAARNPIEDVVGQYVELSKRSGANLFGLCPFHSEKTPSFSVSPGKQIYHCFGCGKGGGVINFIMEIEGLPFSESVEFLANRAGIPVPDRQEDPFLKKRDRMFEINKEAALFFNGQLRDPSGAKAQEYLAKRRISPATATNFGLGFAPDSWDSLRKHMHSKGYSDEELFTLDLIRAGKNGSYYDTFRNRLIFPVIDIRKNVVGFSGRMLGDNEPKYLNSKETPVFVKSQNLFGMNLAKTSKSGYILLVEGNVDVVSLHQAGFDSAVASLGTSLTDEHARLLSRFTQEVIIAYDSDGAGVKASQRAINILEKLDVKVRVLRIPGEKDPDDYIKANGAAAFRNLIEDSESQIDYRLSNIQAKYDLSVPAQRDSYTKEAVSMLARISSRITRQVYASQVAELSGLSVQTVREEIENTHKKLMSKAKQVMLERERRQPLSDAGGHRFENEASAKAEQGIIRLISRDPSLASPPPVRAEEFTSKELGNIYSVLLEFIQEHKQISPAVLAGYLSAEEMNLYIASLGDPEKMSAGRSTMQDYVSKIRQLAAETGSTSLEDLRRAAEEKKKNGGSYK